MMGNEKEEESATERRHAVGARACSRPTIIATAPRYDAHSPVKRPDCARPSRFHIIKRQSSSTLVYSTDPATRLAAGAAQAKARQAVPPSTGGVRLSYETKGRKGKGVTVIRGVPLVPAELEALGKQLRSQCGSGGTVKDGTIEIQGDHRDRVEPILLSRGWTIKRTGG